jgi:hypothetical protein
MPSPVNSKPASKRQTPLLLFGLPQAFAEQF